MAFLAGAVAFAFAQVNIDVGDEVANNFFKYVFGTSAALISEVVCEAIEDSGYGEYELKTYTVRLWERSNCIVNDWNKRNVLVMNHIKPNNVTTNCIYY